MISTNDVVNFIENSKGIKLFEPQIKFLDNLVHGKTTRVPRGFGKSMLINDYADYLNWIEDTGYVTDGYEYDDAISGECLLEMGLIDKNWLKNMISNADDKTKLMLEREYCIEFSK